MSLVWRSVRVPGKLMLSGEYAVLHGATAILACVDRFAEVRVRRSPAGIREHRLITRGYAPGERSFVLDDAGRMRCEPPQPDGQFALVEAVLARLPPPTPIELVIDSSAFYMGDRKLGLGSSAAIAVALSTALSASDDPLDCVDTALAAHREFQNGRGSGADVMAVARGGVTAFRARQQGVEIDSLEWPSGLLAAVILLPRAASTVDQVATFERWWAQDESARALTAMAANAAGRVFEVWRSAKPAVIIDALEAFSERLFQIDQLSGMGYGNGGHRPLRDLADHCNVLYKPCGAGGGDAGIALATSAGALARFTKRAETCGATVAGMKLEAIRPRVNDLPVEGDA